MLGTYYTFPELLIWIPFVTGLIAFFINNGKSVKTFAIISSLLSLTVSVISLFYTDVVHHPEYFYYNNVSYVWMPYIGSSFAVGLDGIGQQQLGDALVVLTLGDEAHAVAEVAARFQTFVGQGRPRAQTQREEARSLEDSGLFHW